MQAELLGTMTLETQQVAVLNAACVQRDRAVLFPKETAVTAQRTNT